MSERQTEAADGFVTLLWFVVVAIGLFVLSMVIITDRRADQLDDRLQRLEADTVTASGEPTP